MVQTSNYWKSVLIRARNETTLFARSKLLLSGVIAAIGLVLQGAWGLHAWGDVGKIILTVLASYLIVTIFAYGFKIVSLPATMNREQNTSMTDLMNQMTGLHVQLREATNPKLDSAEEAIKSEVQAQLTILAVEQKAVLKQVSILGGKLLAGEPLKRLAAKMQMQSSNDLINILRSLEKTHLLNYENPFGSQVYWEIPFGYREVLKKLVWISG